MNWLITGVTSPKMFSCIAMYESNYGTNKLNTLIDTYMVILRTELVIMTCEYDIWSCAIMVCYNRHEIIVI